MRTIHIVDRGRDYHKKGYSGRYFVGEKNGCPYVDDPPTVETSEWSTVLMCTAKFLKQAEDNRREP